MAERGTGGIVSAGAFAAARGAPPAGQRTSEAVWGDLTARKKERERGMKIRMSFDINCSAWC